MTAQETLELQDRDRQRADGAGPRPVRVHLWRPARPAVSPLVLISHGTGGAAAQMTWLADPLAAAGFPVAAVDHHGNNYVDGYIATQFASTWARPLDLSFVLDYLQRTEGIGPVSAVIEGEGSGHRG